MEWSMFFEGLMLICFLAAWPFSIVRMIRTHSSAGKSTFFLCIVLLGYVAGMGYKLSGRFDHVFWLYLINFGVVFIDFLLTLYYRRNPAQ